MTFKWAAITFPFSSQLLARAVQAEGKRARILFPIFLKGYSESFNGKQKGIHSLWSFFPLSPLSLSLFVQVKSFSVFHFSFHSLFVSQSPLSFSSFFSRSFHASFPFFSLLFFSFPHFPIAISAQPSHNSHNADERKNKTEEKNHELSYKSFRKIKTSCTCPTVASACLV